MPNINDYLDQTFLVSFDDSNAGYHIKEKDSKANLKGVFICGFDKDTTTAIKYDDSIKNVIRVLEPTKKGINRSCDAIIIDDSKNINIFLIELKSNTIKDKEIWEKYIVSRELSKCIVSLYYAFEGLNIASKEIIYRYILYSPRVKKLTTNGRPNKTRIKELGVFSEFAYDGKKFCKDKYLG
jgi:hypothetical protein